MELRNTQWPHVVAVVLNWNQRELTLDCLASLQKQDYPNLDIILVDNASQDGSAAAVRAAFPDVTVIENNTNLGYADGNNVGIRCALEQDAAYVLVLNNDTLVSPSMVSELVRVAESQPEIGMVGPMMYCVDPPSTLFAAGSFIDWARGWTWHRGIFQPASAYPKLESPERVDFVTGCGVLVRRQLIEVAGVLDPKYYLNFEDVEWAIRARRHGFETWYSPQAILWHRVSASLGQASPANTYYTTRNALLFFWQNAPAHLRLVAVTHIILRTLRTAAAWTIKPRYSSSIFVRRRNASLLALRDFSRGRFGQMGSDVTATCYTDQ